MLNRKNNHHEELWKFLTEEKSSILQRLLKINRDKTRADGPLEANLEEQAISLENNEVLDALDSHAREKLKNIEYALNRMKSGVFGQCGQCGKNIGMTRLKAMPFALRCIICEGGGNSK